MIRLLYLILALIYPTSNFDFNYVVDADTLDTSLGRVRVLGVNAPEKGERCFNESKEFVESLDFSDMKLERDIENKDKYNRYLRHVRTNKLLSRVLIRSGLAKSYCFFPNLKYCEELKSEQKSAMDEGRGCLWKNSDNRCLIISDVNKKGGLAKISNTCGFEISLDGVYLESDGRGQEMFLGSLCPNCEKTKILEIGDFLMLFDHTGFIDYWAS